MARKSDDATGSALDEATGELTPVPIDDMDISDLNRYVSISDQDYIPDDVDDLNAYFESLGGLIEFKGSVWELVRDKDTLVGTPFTIADIRFYKGKFGDACAVLAITENKDKIVFNDGSTGIYAQCRQMVGTTKRRGGFLCMNGLRKSEYTYQQKDFDDKPIGPEIPAATFYIA